MLLQPAVERGTFQALADEPEPNALVRITPPHAEVFAGGIGTTVVQVETEVSLHEVLFTLQFDPAIISVLDADLEREGVQVGLNPTLIERGADAIQNQVDNSAGIIELQLIGIDAPEAVADLAVITWLGRQEGTAELSLSNVQATAHNQQPVMPDTHSSLIKVTAASSDPIIGRVLLAGRRDYSDTAVYAAEDRCPLSTSNEPRSVTGELVAFTDGSGFFEVIPLDGEIFRCIQVVRRGYLSGQRESPEGDIGIIILPGGDVNEDDVVDIFDLAAIGSHYGDNDPDIDINGDGVVSIFDLVQAATNYGLHGPVTEWR